MKKKLTLLLCILLILCLALPMQVYAASSLSLSTSAKTVKPGATFKAYIKGTECVGRVNISVSNGTASSGSVWVENSTQTISVKAGQSGKVTVKITPEEGMSDMQANEIKPGSKSVTVTISATSSNSGSSSKPAEKSPYAIGDIKSTEYTGSEIKPEVSVTKEGKALKKDTDYTVSYSNNINVGKATVTVKGKGSHSFTLTKNFEITAKAMDSLSLGNIGSQSFTGSFIEPEIVIKNGTVELVEGTDYTVTFENNVAEGTATVKILGKGNYKGEMTSTFDIEKKLFADGCMIHFAIPAIALIGAIGIFLLRYKLYSDIAIFAVIGIASFVLAFLGNCEGDWIMGMISVILIGAEALLITLPTEEE